MLLVRDGTHTSFSPSGEGAQRHNYIPQNGIKSDIIRLAVLDFFLNHENGVIISLLQIICQFEKCFHFYYQKHLIRPPGDICEFLHTYMYNADQNYKLIFSAIHLKCHPISYYWYTDISTGCCVSQQYSNSTLF